MQHDPQDRPPIPRSHELRALFESLDANGDGTLSLTELRALLDELSEEERTSWSPRALFDAADLDGDRHITFEEFLKAMQIETEEAELRTLFAEIDTDRDGALTTEELRPSLRAVGFRLSDAQFQRLMAEIDKNADGTISYDEFAALMRRR